MLFETEAFQLLKTLFNNLFVYGTRPQVLWQIGFGVAIWFLSGVFHKLLKRTLSHRLPLTDEHTTGWQQLATKWINRLWQTITRPVIILALLFLAIQAQTSQNALVGLLIEFVSITVFYLLMQLFIATLYSFGKPDIIQKFLTQFLRPLFVLFVIWRIMSILISMQNLLASELITLFDSPVTVVSALIATIGLYLWVTGANILDEAAVALSSRHQEEVGSSRATFTLMRYLLIVVGISIAISQLNFNATTIAAITGGLSVGVGFALSTILSNFISGLILLFERSIHPGDVIEVDEKLSIVEEVTMRAMRVRTLNNVEVVIPNQTFVASSFTTYTGSDKRIRLQLPIGASYDDPPETVQRVLHDIAMKNPFILKQPEPNVQLVSFGDSSINYMLNVWLASPLMRPKIISDLNFTIYAAFEQNGLSMPFPQRDIHINPSELQADE